MPSGRAKKTRLSIYLIKRDFSGADEIVNGDKHPKRQNIANGGTLFYAVMAARKPKWIDTFFEDEIDASPFTNMSTCAALLVPVSFGEDEERVFVLTFGYGLSLINKDAIEERFGLKTVLNSVPSDSIRRINITSVAGNARKTSEQMPLRSVISAFSIDVNQDLLNGITAVGEAGELLEGSVTGADALTVSTATSVSSVRDYLSSIYEVYQSESYKQDFGWIDQISPVKSKDIRTSLDAELVKLVRSGSESVWMAVPELIEWDKCSGFRYSKTGDLHDDITIREFCDSLRRPIESIDSFKRHQIELISSDSDIPLNNWSAYKCLYGEMSYLGKQYCINGGDWYQVSEDYREDIEKEYARTRISSIDYIDYKDLKGEGEYNKLFADRNAGSMLLMDQKFIKYGGNGSKFELCDILSEKGQFIHIKHYSGSSTLSHLFNQGLTTAELARSDEEFLRLANEVIEKQRGGENKFRVSKSSPAEVAFGIISKESASLPNVPFFSKISFCNVKRHLEAMGVTVSIRAIHEVK